MGETMKTCPICGAQTIDRAVTCFECLYNFKEMSTGVVLFSELEDKQNLRVDLPPREEIDTQESMVCAEDASAASPCTEESLKECEQQFCDLLIEMYHRGRLRSRYRSHSGSLYVGAASFNDIKIDTPHVAKRHLHFYRTGDTVFAETLSENYPVYLNGHELSGIVPISAHDTISLGEVRFALSRSMR